MHPLPFSLCLTGLAVLVLGLRSGRDWPTPKAKQRVNSSLVAAALVLIAAVAARLSGF